MKHDAIVTGSKSVTVIQKKQDIASRIRTLKQLVYDTFVTNVPAGHNKRFDIYHHAKPRIRELGLIGGPEYEDAVNAVKFAYLNQEAHAEAVKSIMPMEEPMESGDHMVADYDSSDETTRYGMSD